jgi:hypothetical protein
MLATHWVVAGPVPPGESASFTFLLTPKGEDFFIEANAGGRACGKNWLDV